MVLIEEGYKDSSGEWVGKAERQWTPRTTEGIQAKVCFLAGCLTSQQHASVSQGRMCSYKLACCHTEIEVVDQTFYPTQSQYTDIGRPVSALTQ